eukprot:2615701-Pyramimonas_sp.AAC.1
MFRGVSSRTVSRGVSWNVSRKKLKTVARVSWNVAGCLVEVPVAQCGVVKTLPCMQFYIPS